MATLQRKPDSDELFTFAMTPSTHSTLPLPIYLLWIALAIFLLAFTWGGSIGSEADTSVYLIMARWFSGDRSVAVEALMHQSQFPPLYPFFLAVINGEEWIEGARVFTTTFLLFSLTAYRFWLRQQNTCEQTATWLILLFALSPWTLILSLELLSESLYLLLSMATLGWATKANESNDSRQKYLAILFAALTMTSRTIGLALIMAMGIQGLRQPKLWKISLLGLALLPAALWWLFKQTVGFSGGYVQTFVNHLIDAELGLWPAMLHNISTQCSALLTAWLESFGLFPGWPQQLLAVATGIAALIGLSRRLFRWQTDALYVSFYLIIILLWPFPSHTGRFLWPLLPMLFFYAWETASKIRYISRAIPWLVVLALLPTWQHIGNRWWQGQLLAIPDYADTQRWYSYEKIAAAREDAAFRQALNETLQAIPKTVPEDACVYFLRPADLVLLAGRVSIIFPTINTMPEHFHLTDCEWVLLTNFTSKLAPKPFYPIAHIQENLIIHQVFSRNIGNRKPGALIAILGRYESKPRISPKKTTRPPLNKD